MRVTRELVALRERWVELFSVPAPPDMTVALLKLAIGWKEHVDQHGDISPALARDLQVIARTERDRKRGVVHSAAASASAADLPASTRLVPGAKLVKVYQGTTYVVEVGEGSFSWNGESYASLSAVAKAITGTHWNGLLFFGLRTRRVKPRHERAAASSNVRDARTSRAKAVRHA
ncbi:DUF2924 domain-containing protein [Sphingomonas jatrophae]|uniref:DUF2924 domain-containing protein n=1 Tax=Sphingomonas jatrophae TaxID=1166337 RepID=A0A1I6M0F2_9SPHN|nr:DUF2924 domain-containing protein [Sphingomonas jatrophae]SFS09114.1 Protein of unknown function [Sphingomonas jatrophae]